MKMLTPAQIYTGNAVTAVSGMIIAGIMIAPAGGINMRLLCIMISINTAAAAANGSHIPGSHQKHP